MERHTPAQGVLPTWDGNTILWCTVCAENRQPWCAQPAVIELLRDLWTHPSNAWLVGDFLVMPDHMHFFCTPAAQSVSDVEAWSRYWKTQFSRQCHHPEWRWQRGIFHHRLRSEQEYVEKGDYMRQNPRRLGLVNDPDEWPWQGRLREIRW